jgi:hypothetical protein
MLGYVGSVRYVRIEKASSSTVDAAYWDHFGTERN